jgi:cyclase
MVKGTRFNAWRSVGLAAQAVRIHAARGVDEVCLLDIAATPEGRLIDPELVSELADSLFVPLTVGGGIRTAEDARRLLRAGADKVVVGTAGPRAISEISMKVGSQAVVAACDDRNGRAHVRCGNASTHQSALGWARSCYQHGAGEILLTAIDLEGTMQGYDLYLIGRISEALPIPVIAHGGAGTYQHLLEALEVGADAVAAGAMFQFTDQTPRGAAAYLCEHGLEVRV